MILAALVVCPLPGVIWKHFTARDAISRWDGSQARTAQLPRPLFLSGAAMIQRLEPDAERKCARSYFGAPLDQSLLRNLKLVL